MKAFLCLIALCLSQSAFSTGRLILKPVMQKDTHVKTYTLGLSVYEPLLLGISYVSYTSLGESFKNYKYTWAKSENGLEVLLGEVNVGFGLQYKYVPFQKYDETAYYGTLSKILW